jgi:peptide chain release factor subunit 1
MLMSELTTASNIKDKNNRKNVTTALKSIIEKLKMQKVCPDNGLAIFAGHVHVSTCPQDSSSNYCV